MELKPLVPRHFLGIKATLSNFVDISLLLIAPFCLDDTSSWFSPGRSRKLAQVESILSRLNITFERVNTAPFSSTTPGQSWIALCSREWWPLRWIQIFISSAFLRCTYCRSRSSVILWVYNPRFDEAILAWVLTFAAKRRSRLILQVEDLPSARSESAGLRGLLDRIACKWLTRNSSAITCVSTPVSKALEELTGFPAARCILFPPLLDPDLLECVLRRQPPFREPPYSILYAGGYSFDKGVDILIDAFLKLDPRLFRLHLYGPMPESLCQSLSKSSFITVHGQVSLPELFHAYSKADIIVNPHRQIKNSNFIFPFKLAEVLSSGSLPLSSPMPGLESYGYPQRLLFTSSAELFTLLNCSPSLWQQYSETFGRIQQNVIMRHCEDVLAQEISRVLEDRT